MLKSIEEVQMILDEHKGLYEDEAERQAFLDDLAGRYEINETDLVSLSIYKILWKLCDAAREEFALLTDGVELNAIEVEEATTEDEE